MSELGAYVRGKKIIVCCGAGGVGKTTTSAALALAGARLGKRVLVLTIDPSKRLAETLGVARNPRDPIRLTPEREAAAGIAAPGALSAWMLDPKLVSDATVRKLSKTPADAERLMANPIYQQITRMIAGMQEYTAMEALHGFVAEGRYDLVVLDTPPSRNALNFLDAPGRLAQFLDGRIFQLFLPKEGGFFRGAATKIVDKVLATVFGAEFAADLRVFFDSFASIFSTLGGNAHHMRDRLRGKDATFLLVTSPAQNALDDARFFEAKIKELGLPLGGFVLNRSRASRAKLPLPDASMLPAGAGAAEQAALEKLLVLAKKEKVEVEAHLRVLDGLKTREKEGIPAVALPEIDGGVDTIEDLVRVAKWLVGEA